MAMYTQGFGHAQDRLWQMQKQRMLGSGRLSEMFGPKAVNMDKFQLTVGFRRVATETWNTPDMLETEERELLQAYADGVNDYLAGVGFFNSDHTAYLLPPEFHVLGIKEVEPWHPIDSLVIMRLMNFHLSYNWSQDLLREIFGDLEDGALKDLVEELVPFNAENSINLKTILDEDDMKQAGLYSEETLMSRYKSKTPIDYGTTTQPKETPRERAARLDKEQQARLEAMTPEEQDMEDEFDSEMIDDSKDEITPPKQEEEEDMNDMLARIVEEDRLKAEAEDRSKQEAIEKEERDRLEREQHVEKARLA